MQKLAGSKSAENLDTFQDLLVSNHTGIVKSLHAVPKDFSKPALPIVYAAELSNHGFFPKGERNQLNCSGKGMDKPSAVTSALGEAMERYSATWIKEGEVEYKSFDAFAPDEALDPRKLVLYMEHQYANLPFAPFDPSLPIGWVKAYSLLREKPLFIPAQPTFLNYTLQYPQEYIGQATSNGLAAGPTLIDAILSAALEVIERDIFLIVWHNMLLCEQVDPLTHPDKDIADYCAAYERRGVKLKLFRLPTDAPCNVFMAIGVQEKGEGPAIVVGLGADFSSTVAARQALMEVGQIRPSFKQRLRKAETKDRLQELIKDPQKVEELEDHDLLYAAKDHLSAFDFLFQRPVTALKWEEKKTAPLENLGNLLRFLDRIQSDLIYFNLTPPDMRNINIHTVRAVLPGFQPIHFGSKNIRLAGRRLYELGHSLGISDKESTWSSLNPYPHPLA
jgi:ribosomal protein S12 methylthiotransferase accessory factor